MLTIMKVNWNKLKDLPTGKHTLKIKPTKEQIFMRMNMLLLNPASVVGTFVGRSLH